MFQVSFLGDWWYLVLQHVLDYFDLLGLFPTIIWLSKANWPSYVALGRAIMPHEVYFG